MQVVSTKMSITVKLVGTAIGHIFSIQSSVSQSQSLNIKKASSFMTNYWCSTPMLLQTGCSVAITLAHKLASCGVFLPIFTKDSIQRRRWGTLNLLMVPQTLCGGYLNFVVCWHINSCFIFGTMLELSGLETQHRFLTSFFLICTLSKHESFKRKRCCDMSTKK